MSNFINTVDIVGDSATMSNIISRTIKEFRDNVIEKVGDFVFRKCEALVDVDLPNLKAIGSGSFFRCSKLTSINAPNVETIGSDAFSYCLELEKLDLSKATYIATKVFCYSPKFSTLILRAGSVAGLQNVAAFTGTLIANGTGYIYVSRALVEEYKAATNWSTFANQFRALEDYTVDGTITGELDESKI